MSLFSGQLKINFHLTNIFSSPNYPKIQKIFLGNQSKHKYWILHWFLPNFFKKKKKRKKKKERKEYIGFQFEKDNTVACFTIINL